jgi:molybdopterin synthase sulfur carrier subunit
MGNHEGCPNVHGQPRGLPQRSWATTRVAPTNPLFIMATVIIPTPLRKFTNNTSKLDVQATTVAEAIQDLSTNFPDLKKHLLDDGGQIRTFLNIFVGDDDIRDLQNGQTALTNDTIVSIIPAIAGGSK